MKYLFAIGFLCYIPLLNAQINQPFDPHMEAYVNGSTVNALTPLDTGFVDVCLGDSILFVSTPNFYNSLENTGTGYSQDVNFNIDFEWTIGNLSYPNNDTILFIVSLANGHIVDLNIIDQNGEDSSLTSKIRVGIPPDFSWFHVVNEPVCSGDETQIIGGANGEGTSFTIPGGSFSSYSSQYITALTPLPDGSGSQYNTPITITGFPQGAIITNDQELNQVCIAMEHSYSGDLEIWLECPNGSIVPLVNSYGAGAIPGGNSGGGTYLGDPIDDGGGGGPGEGWEYCFSSVLNDLGPMSQNWGNTIPALNFGNGNPSVDPTYVYAPESSFAGFAGCPFNGEWTLFVQDNLSIDDGHIFGWGLDFYAPNVEISNYQNTVDSAWWSTNVTIIENIGDTALIVAPETNNASYTFNVMDDFGCAHDTTVMVAINDISAALDVTPTQGCVPVVIAIDYSASVGDSFYVEFGDGISYSSTLPENISHFYADVITDSVILYVTNDNCYDTAYVAINTLAGTTTYLADSAFCGEPYDWSGDLIYTEGTYTQVLQGTNGCDSVDILEITFIDQDFGLSFIANQQLFTTPPFAVQFTNTTPNMSDYDFWWDFGDGTTIQSNNLNVFHEFTANGLFTVSLFATDLTNCSNTLIETDYIYTTGLNLVNQNELISYQIHPNPSSNLISIQFENPMNNTFLIFDQQGRQVLKGKLTGKETQVSLVTLSKGSYTIQIEGHFKPAVIVKN
ncbi:MAG: T9SS type A sorting domain-containing protein [Crocinitomicaceae bacterium]|nr:T9SS type A sorting domain-containing protein [Crocinitomicaceae bacterium]